MKNEYPENVPYGYCHCGCGEKTNIARSDRAEFGHIKGQPFRYLLGHQPKHFKYREEHAGWKGNDAKKDAKNMRARKWFEISGMCEECGIKPAVDRHHKDGNPGHNERSNIAFLCRRCHMLVDGRLKQLHAKPRPKLPPRPCIHCKRLDTRFLHGRCPACSEYYRRNGVERPLIDKEAVQREIKEQAERMYTDYQTGLSLKEVGMKHGCSETTVYHRLKDAGFQRRSSASERTHNLEKGQKVIDYRRKGKK